MGTPVAEEVKQSSIRSCQFDLYPRVLIGQQSCSKGMQHLHTCQFIGANRSPLKFYVHLRGDEHHTFSFYVYGCCGATSFAKLFVEPFQQSNFKLIAFVQELKIDK